MYLTAGISVALVLLLIGLECVLVLSARGLIRQVKENVSLTVVLNDNAPEEEVARLENMLKIAPFCHQERYISKEEALNEHIASLGEDPTEFLGYNPIEASLEVNISENYAQVDSLQKIETIITQFEAVRKVIYQKDVVSALDSVVNKLSLVFLGAAIILLIVALALIVNTIRLHVYSKRFIISTMKLVGACPWTIRRPIVARNVAMGFCAALLALLLLGAVLWYCKAYLSLTLIAFTWQNVALVAAVVVLSGIIITLFASVFATNRYIRMKTNDLYFV